MLYLLHGLSDDDTIWLRRTSIERYVAPLGLAVVMPQVHRSFYTDEAYGGRYWTFLSEELPELVGAFFRVSQAREDTFVAGLSMGGYGALKWALRQPGAVRRRGQPVRRPRRRRPARAPRRGGPDAVATGSSATDACGHRRRPVRAARARRPGERCPALYVWLRHRGRADRIEPAVRRRRASAAGHHGDPDFGPGEHEWGYWDAHIQDVLAWLPLTGPRVSSSAAVSSSSVVRCRSASASSARRDAVVRAVPSRRVR